jgi:hypothetical protein
MKRASSLATLALVAAASASPAVAQQPANPTPTPAPALPIPAVGDMAPDFTLPGVTRFGVLRDPVKLSDYRGQTVVVWFFIRARTKG